MDAVSDFWPENQLVWINQLVKITFFFINFLFKVNINIYLCVEKPILKFDLNAFICYEDIFRGPWKGSVRGPCE